VGEEKIRKIYTVPGAVANYNYVFIRRNSPKLDAYSKSRLLPHRKHIASTSKVLAG
jgi:hypothetical protein